MEVFTFDGERLGTVLLIETGDAGPEGGELLPSVRQESEIDGESLGPAPTQAFGNTGPIAQSARNRYAARPPGPRAPGVRSFLVGDWHGLLNRRRIPVDDVQTVSMERIILRRRIREYK
jgi:hypothetical protein